MKVVPATFQAHYARWLRMGAAAAQAVAFQRWENEGGKVKQPRDAAAPGIPL